MHHRLMNFGQLSYFCYINFVILDTFLTLHHWDRTPHRAGSKARETPTRAHADAKPRTETANAARAGGKGTKNYRIAETRTRRERALDDTDVMQRASQIVMYVASTPILLHRSLLKQSLYDECHYHSSFDQILTIHFYFIFGLI